jgi:hypothetical protein
MKNEDRSTVHPMDVRTPVFRNFYCSDIILDRTRFAVVVEGLPESRIYGLSLDHVLVTPEKGVSC